MATTQTFETIIKLNSEETKKKLEQLRKKVDDLKAACDKAIVQCSRSFIKDINKDLKAAQLAAVRQRIDEINASQKATNSTFDKNDLEIEQATGKIKRRVVLGCPYPHLAQVGGGELVAEFLRLLHHMHLLHRICVQVLSVFEPCQERGEPHAV